MILTPSLEEGEECPICINVLELNECSRSVLHRLHFPSIPVTQRISLSCQHIFCNSCLSKLGGGKDINCPQCRRPSDIEDLEQVEVTATQQWDQLLELAQQFAAMEGQLGPDTSEEEEEEKLRENFIDDGDTEARFVVVARWILSACLLLQYVIAGRLRSMIQRLTLFEKTYRTGMRETMLNWDTFHTHSPEWLKRESG